MDLTVTLPVIAGVVMPALAALAIRLRWRPRTTPWDA